MTTRVDVLGPLAVHHDGTPLVPAGDKPGRILALLALRAGHVVPVSALMREIWGAGPPRTAPTMLQTYVLQLRRALQPATRAWESGGHRSPLTTVPGGYRLALAPGAVDALVFDDRLGRGLALLGREDARAVPLLDEAVAQWRGPMLPGLTRGPVLGAEAARLEENRRNATEQRIAARLRLGRYDEVVGELRRLTAHDTAHESLHALLMVALYRSGRRREALWAFERLRATLIEELGIEPSAALEALSQAISRAGAGVRRPRALAMSEG